MEWKQRGERKSDRTSRKWGSVKTHLVHSVDKELGGVIGEVIDQSGPVFVRGELFNPRNDFIRNRASGGLYVDVGMDG